MDMRRQTEEVIHTPLQRLAKRFCCHAKHYPGIAKKIVGTWEKPLWRALYTESWSTSKGIPLQPVFIGSVGVRSLERTPLSKPVNQWGFSFHFQCYEESKSMGPGLRGEFTQLWPNILPWLVPCSLPRPAGEGVAFGEDGHEVGVFGAAGVVHAAHEARVIHHRVWNARLHAF